MHRVPYLRIDFNQSLEPYETPRLRSRVIAITRGRERLYHNHLNDGVIYGYPLIQYKSIRRHASIVYLGDGVDSIPALFNRIQAQPQNGFDFTIKNIHSTNLPLHFIERGFTYRIINWLPLDEGNFKIHQSLTGESQRIELLKSVFKSNVLAFASAVGWRLDRKIRIDHFRILKKAWISFKSIKFLGFHVEIKSNVYLPPYIGLGRGAAHNYGVVYHYD